MQEPPTNNPGGPSKEDLKKETPTEDINPEVKPSAIKPPESKRRPLQAKPAYSVGEFAETSKTSDIEPLGQIPQKPKPTPSVRTPQLTHNPESPSGTTGSAPEDKVTIRPDFQREPELPPTDNTKKPSTLKRIRTLGGDTSEFIKKGKLSMTDLFLKQQKQTRESGVHEIEQEKPFYKKGGFLIGLLVLIIFGAGGGYLSWFIKQEPEEVIIQTPTPPKPLIISQETIIIETHDSESSTGLKSRLQSLFHKRYDAGDLIYIPIQKEVIGGYSFLSSKLFLKAIETNAPTFLTTFLENDFYLGTLILKKNHPVLILKTQKQQRDNTYAGMLRWEKDMLENLDFISNMSNISTSTPSMFEDILVKNYSTRSIQNEKGTVLMYGFFNREYIIITDDPEAFEEVIERFILFEFS
ncbi:hypothetical protein ACFLY5_00025 [Patescibacteria group bacterium]